MRKSTLARLLYRQETALALFTVAVFACFSFISPSNFFTGSNFQLILQQVSINAICVLGVGMVVILGGIDLSVGAVLTLSGAFGGMMVLRGLPIWLCVIIAVGVGALCGAFNALLITRLQLPPIITTLATNYLFRGLAIFLTGGSWVNHFPAEFTRYGTGRVFGTSNVFWMFLFLLAAMSYLLNDLNIGRKMYAVGTSNDAADKSGIDSTRVKYFGYMTCGGLVGFAGLMYGAQIGAISTTSTGLLMGTQLLAACLAGGISIAGGRGTLLGAAIGVLMIGIIRNGLILVRVSEYWVEAVTGAVILLALALNVVNANEKRRKES